MSFIQSKEWMNRPDATELDRELFSEFWAQFFNIFKKLDKNGDQEITIPEALKWFQVSGLDIIFFVNSIISIFLNKPIPLIRTVRWQRA